MANPLFEFEVDRPHASGQLRQPKRATGGHRVGEDRQTTRVRRAAATMASDAVGSARLERQLRRVSADRTGKEVRAEHDPFRIALRGADRGPICN